MYITLLFYNILAIISSIIMIYAKSPVRSVLSLILTFTFVTIVFLHLNVQFASLVLLLVYLGAVIVMFLILVMFINIRVYKTSYLELFNFNIFTVLLIIFSIIFYVLINVHLGLSSYYIKWFNLFDNIGILSTLCFHVFNLLNIEVFLVVFLLLISMIASMSIVFIEVQNLWKNDSKKVTKN